MRIAIASAQLPPVIPPPRAVRVGDVAYWVGKPRVLLPADVDDIHISPDRRYVLAICRQPHREPFDGEEEAVRTETAKTLPHVMRRRSGTVSLIVYDTVRDRVTTLWKRKASGDETLIFNNLCWLFDSKRAMATVSVITLLPKQEREIQGKRRAYQPIRVDTDLLIFSVPRRSMRTVPLLQNNAFQPLIQILPALTENRALLSVCPKHSDPVEFRFVNVAGELTPTVSAEIHFAGLSGWTEGDSKVIGSAQHNARSDRKGTCDVEIDGKTGAVTLVDERSGYKEATVPERQTSRYDLEMPLHCFSEIVPVNPDQERSPLFAATCVILQSATDPEERVLVTTEGDPLGIVGVNEERMILYRAHDALHGVALKTVPLPVYEQAVRSVARQRASRLRTRLLVWCRQHNTVFPPLGTDIATLLVRHDEDRSGTDFDDPHTGRPAFTYLYAGESDTSPPLFSLGTIGGKYVGYSKGNTPCWVPEGTPIPETEPIAS